MNRLATLLICSVLFLSACGRWDSDHTGAPEPKYVQDLSQASEKIKQTKEFESCLEPSVNMCINQVANQLARSAKSVDFCNELKDGGAKDACTYGVISMLASEKNDISLCNPLASQYKKECRIMIMRSEARASGKIESCDKLTSELSVSSETNFDMSRVDQCRLEVILAKDKKDKDLCETIKTKSLQDMCVNMIKNTSIQ